MSEELIDQLARRFAGVDVQYRHEWGWRARVVASKNERAEYRVEVYGSTMSEAVFSLLAKVREIDDAKFSGAAVAPGAAAP